MSDKIDKDWNKVRESVEEAVDESVPDALAHPSYVELESKLTEAEQLAHENWEKCVRATAEVDNIRRRAERDVANAHRYALEKCVDSLLPVIDSLERALELALQLDDKPMHEGLALTMKLLIDALQKQGVEPIDPLGELFDPAQHEAMSMQPAEGVAANTVTMVFQKGYVLNGRVIRPARVVVSK